MGKTHDVLEYTAASGSVSLLLGKDDLILEILDFESFSSDTPDFGEEKECVIHPMEADLPENHPIFIILRKPVKVYSKTGLAQRFCLRSFICPMANFQFK